MMLDRRAVGDVHVLEHVVSLALIFFPPEQ